MIKAREEVNHYLQKNLHEFLEDYTDQEFLLSSGKIQIRRVQGDFAYEYNDEIDSQELDIIQQCVDQDCNKIVEEDANLQKFRHSNSILLKNCTKDSQLNIQEMRESEVSYPLNEGTASQKSDQNIQALTIESPSLQEVQQINFRSEHLINEGGHASKQTIFPDKSPRVHKSSSNLDFTQPVGENPRQGHRANIPQLIQQPS